MSSSDLSELTSDVSTDEEAVQAPANKGKLDHYFKHGSNAAQAPPTLKKKRPPSPPHEYVLADNPDIAVCRTASLHHLSRPACHCRVADSSGHSVHLHVPIPLQRRLPEIVTALWPSRYREWSRWINTWGSCGEVVMWAVGAGVESEKRHRVRHPIPLSIANVSTFGRGQSLVHGTIME